MSIFRADSSRGLCGHLVFFFSLLDTQFARKHGLSLTKEIGASGRVPDSS